jgi:uncharacterized heparinase superfamily protein
LRTDVSGSALPDTQEAFKATAEEILAFMTEWNRIFPLHAAGARTSAWHPYVLSIRIETWIRLMTRLQECGIPPDEPRMREINHGVERMTRVLLRNLEKGTMANHLLRNIKALVLAGLFLDTEIGAQSRRIGLKLLERELREQVLADGCHFERSPMYHVSVLNDVLDMTEAIMLAGSTVPEILSETAGRMTGFLERIRHTDGEIPYFNDSTGSFFLRTEEVLQRGRILCHELECAVDADMPFATEVSPARTSGLLTAGTTRSWIVFDAGNIGPDYQPGHAHCDTLSLEWSLDGQRVITDTGVFHYRESPERHYSRSTAAHSTIIVDGMEQSEVWKSFRVGRRAKILRFAQESQEGMTVLRGAHDGYRRLRSPVIHERAVVMAGEAWIAVIDWLHGRGEHSIRSHMHFHPVVRVADPVAVDDHWHTRISVGETMIAFHATGFHRTERLETEYYPAFGERRMRQTLRMDARITLPHMTAVVYGIECEGNPIRLRAEKLAAEISASDGHPFLLSAMGWE